jgi:hypothetical protein
MKRVVTACSLTFIILMAAFAAPATFPNYKGTWILNYNESKGLPAPPPGVNAGGIQIEMMVAQDEKQFKVKSNMFGGQNIAYNLDGSKSKAQMGKVIPGEAIIYLEKKDDGEIVLYSERDISVEGQSLTLKSTEIWKLSNNGKILTVNRVSESPRGKHEVSLVFTRRS